MKIWQSNLCLFLALLLSVAEVVAGDGPKGNRDVAMNIPSAVRGIIENGGVVFHRDKDGSKTTITGSYNPSTGEGKAGVKYDSHFNGKSSSLPLNEKTSGPSGAYNKNDSRKDGGGGGGFGGGSSNSKQL